MLLAIKSPKPTKVKRIYTPLKAPVSTGDLLIELYDYEEAKLLSEIDRAIAENDAKRSEVHGPFVADKMTALQAVVAARKVALEASHVVYQEAQDECLVGEITIVELAKARQDVALRSYQLLQSAIEQEIYNRNTADAISVYDQVATLLQKEREYVETASARLRITAPKSGLFSCYVTEGTPVRLGHVLGEIDY
jgi:biotin carboxyl carrier protein